MISPTEPLRRRAVPQKIITEGIHARLGTRHPKQPHGMRTQQALPVKASGRTAASIADIEVIDEFVGVVTGSNLLGPGEYYPPR